MAVLSCRCREWNNMAIANALRRGECHALRLRNAVLAPQMAVGFHCQRAAILVSKPARDSRNIDTAFDAARGEQVPQIVMRNAICADFFARSIKRLLAFADAEYFRIQRLAGTFASHSLKQRVSVRNQRDAAQFPILRAGIGIDAHDDLACVKIHVSPCDFSRFDDATTCERQSRRQVCTVYRVATVAPCISAIMALNFLVVGNEICLVRTAARFTTTVGLL
jgi:hypothetical protein